MEFYNSKEVKKTRKDHKCFLCQLDIPTGSNCMYESGKYDGEFFSRYSHNECAEKWVDMNRDAYGGDDWLDFREMADVYPHDRFSDWQRRIGEIYGVLDGDGL